MDVSSSVVLGKVDEVPLHEAAKKIHRASQTESVGRRKVALTTMDEVQLQGVADEDKSNINQPRLKTGCDCDHQKRDESR